MTAPTVERWQTIPRWSSAQRTASATRKQSSTVYPAEIEGFLLEHPAVAQAAVIGVPDERMGQVGKAFLVLAANERAFTADELVAWSRNRMAGFKVPRYVEFRKTLPLNATGKVMKTLLR